MLHNLQTVKELRNEERSFYLHWIVSIAWYIYTVELLYENK